MNTRSGSAKKGQDQSLVVKHRGPQMNKCLPARACVCVGVCARARVHMCWVRWWGLGEGWPFKISWKPWEGLETSSDYGGRICG